MRRLRALTRLFHVVVHLFGGMLTVGLIFPCLSAVQRGERVQRWARAMLVVLAIDLEILGQPPESGPVLLVANHISWLDILVMHAARHCRFVAKREIRYWPVIGLLANAAGTLFIERNSRRDAMRVVHGMAECLQMSQILAVFPEGTTGDGTQVLPFHGNLLQAAISTQSPVQPVALRFVDKRSGHISHVPSYIGDETLLRSVWRTLCSSDLQAVVHFGVAQDAQNRDRRTWAKDLRSAVMVLRG